jgi:periplasmic divalent cation tolerance protein
VSSPTLVVLTTCATAEDAKSLATALVEERLAACVNTLSPVTSTYRWQGAVQQEQECLLVIKTTEARFAALEQLIRERSTYELPEVLAIPVQTGSARYLDWLRAAVGDD